MLDYLALYIVKGNCHTSWLTLHINRRQSAAVLKVSLKTVWRQWRLCNSCTEGKYVIQNLKAQKWGLIHASFSLHDMVINTQIFSEVYQILSKKLLTNVRNLLQFWNSETMSQSKIRPQLENLHKILVFHISVFTAMLIFYLYYSRQ